jgi:UDP-N-acetylglucosamine 2-epimerase (non-hydrolysing)
MQVVTVLGTRPEIIKLSPLIPLLDKQTETLIVHTGQHYDYEMDRIFFDELELRNPDYELNVGSGSHMKQISQIMRRLEPILEEHTVDIVIVQGDTNTTLAGALTGAKMNIPVAHVEAGCRSFNRDMPEETNRILADHCSSLLFAPDHYSLDNLIREGINPDFIRLVGDTVIDACERINVIVKYEEFRNYTGLEDKEYVLVTVHRAETTDSKERLEGIATALNEISDFVEVVLPLHPRTNNAMERYNITLDPKILVIKPLGYRLFTSALKDALFVMTDSGGIQKEAGVLNVPCLILRDETEWMELVEIGKNLLVGIKAQQIVEKVRILVGDRDQLDQMRALPSGLKAGASEKILNELLSFSTS